jgi:hypothetical protein
MRPNLERLPFPLRAAAAFIAQTSTPIPAARTRRPSTEHRPRYRRTGLDIGDRSTSPDASRGSFQPLAEFDKTFSALHR